MRLNHATSLLLNVSVAVFVHVVTVVLVVSVASSVVTAAIELNSLHQEIYDYDASWAIKSKHLSSELGPHKQELYDHFMNECRVNAKEKAGSVCDGGEDFRIKMNNEQPMSMRNYTTMGFKKIRAPEKVFSVIKKFWDEHRYINETEWHSINTYHNMWASPPTIVNIQLPEHGGGPQLTNQVWDAARDTLEEWTGMRLSPCSIWGVRIYPNNSILTPHVDRNPLVTSAIINVDQDVDEPWPLEVWGHDGKPYNVTMEPGDMVLYESHTILHGRPFPMRGRFFANIFVHFEPLGAFRKDPSDDSHDVYYQDEALDSLDMGLPPYVVPGSPWEHQWREAHPNGWELLHKDIAMGVKQNNQRVVEDLYIQDPESIHYLDDNGWGALHEAARAGHVDMAKFLHERGVDLHLKTGHGVGNTALELALNYHGEESEIYKFLFGAMSEDEEEL